MIPLRGGPAHGKSVNFHEGKAIIVPVVMPGGYGQARYAVERVNGKAVYAQFIPFRSPSPERETPDER